MTYTKDEALVNDLPVITMYRKIVRLKKVVCQGAFFVQHHGTLHEDLRAFYCCWRNKIARPALLRSVQYFDVDECDV
jgi:hypothetical protein